MPHAHCYVMPHAGIERFTVAHDRGSSHGLSRIIRMAYWEHPDYVPLLRRAYELWRKLEAETHMVITYSGSSHGVSWSWCHNMNAMVNVLLCRPLKGWLEITGTALLAYYQRRRSAAVLKRTNPMWAWARPTTAA